MAKKRSGATKGANARQKKTAAVRISIVEPQFREDLIYWVSTNRALALRALDLMDHILRDPFKGIGKPEPLKHLGADIWSRRLSQSDRIVYLVEHDCIRFLQARYHYE